MERFILNGADWEIKDFLGEDWIWRNAEKRNTKDARWWRKANVPGSISYDLWKLGEIPDPYFERNSLLIEWVPERTWIYRKRFTPPASMKGKAVTLHFEGIDYAGYFYLNDVLLGRHESMYTPVSFDVTNTLDWEGENQITVVLDKAPDEQPQVSKTSYVRTHKSRMTYWWDFCPRMIHMGIWDDVYLEAHGNAVIQDVFVRPKLESQFTCAKLLIQVTVMSEIRQQGMVKLQVQENGQDRKALDVAVELFEGKNVIPAEILLEDPKLWWPNGYGEQPLYSLCSRLEGEGKEILHNKSVVFGIRELCFLSNEGAELNADGYTLSVNGKKIYVKGWNWVPMDVMYGVKRPGKLNRLLTLVREANVNMLRIWGGGLIEREDFYRLCDESGILLWQEFIQSSSGIDNKPSDEEEFLRLMEREAQQIIPRKRNHPSLALWCGGNELQSENQSMIKDSEPVIQLLRRGVMELDPDRKFLPSSPSGRIFNNDLKFIEKDPQGLHDVHGPWEHQGLVAQYTLYNKGTSLLSSEYGVEGMTNYNTLAKSMDESHMWPPSRDNIYYFHRGSWWNNYVLLQESFGDGIKDIRTAIMASQFLQYEGLRYSVESNRRRAFHNSGSLMWQFNEPYPNNYCTCCVDYYAQPKPAYYGVARSYGTHHISASFQGQSMAGFQDLDADIYCHNSGNVPVDWHVICRIAGSSGREYFRMEEKTKGIGESWKACTVHVPLDKIEEEHFFLILEGIGQDGETAVSSRYFFTKSQNLRSLLEQQESDFIVEVWKDEDLKGGDLKDGDLKDGDLKDEIRKKDIFKDDGSEALVTIRNQGIWAAAGLKLEKDGEPEGEDTGDYIYFSDNFLYLLPGEEAKVLIRTNEEKISGMRIKMSGLGVKEQTFSL